MNPAEDRLLTFEVGGSFYALPIGGILEVADVGRLGCIPTLPPHVGGVMNHHGDALPVVHRAPILAESEAGLPAPEQVIVITDRAAGAARLGVAVDRVLGLVAGRAAVARGPDPVAERRTIAGRVASILDPQRLVERAREVIEQSVGRNA